MELNKLNNHDMGIDEYSCILKTIILLHVHENCSACLRKNYRNSPFSYFVGCFEDFILANITVILKNWYFLENKTNNLIWRRVKHIHNL